MPQRNAQSVAQKWVQRTGAAGQAYKEGVMGVTESPTAAAARNAQVYAQRVQESVNNGTFQAGCMRVSLSDWQTKCVNLGAARLAEGARQAEDRFRTFMDAFLPYVDQAAAQVRSMPKGTLEQGLARAEFMIRKTAEFKGRARR